MLRDLPRGIESKWVTLREIYRKKERPKDRKRSIKKLIEERLMKRLDRGREA